MRVQHHDQILIVAEVTRIILYNVADKTAWSYLEIPRREPARWWSGISVVNSGTDRCPLGHHQHLAVWRM